MMIEGLTMIDNNKLQHFYSLIRCPRREGNKESVLALSEVLTDPSVKRCQGTLQKIQCWWK
jgi:hypothetical protein